MNRANLIPNIAEVELICLRQKAGIIQVELRARRPFSVRPSCAGHSSRVHSRYRRTITDLPWEGIPVEILLQADPLHYLALLEQKTRALDQAAPLAGWKLPDCFAELRRLLEARLRKHGSREYVQVLRLMETFDLSEVTHAIEDALKLGTISFDAVRHLMLCRIERRPPRLDMQNYPHLPLAQVHTTQAADCMSLLVEVCA